MNNNFNYITEENLSIGWSKAFLKVMETKEISPFVVSITGFESGEPIEVSEIRDSVNSTLTENNTKLTIDRVANTIFPASLWNKNLPRQKL